MNIPFVKKWKPEKKENFVNLIVKIESITNFTVQKIAATIKAFMKYNNLEMGEVTPILRVALAGGLQGPPVFAIINVLGGKNSVARIHNSIKIIDNFH